MFTSHGFRLYNIETFCSTHPNAYSYCSAVTPQSSEITGSATSDRSLIVTIKESALSISFFTLLYYGFINLLLRTNYLILSDGAQGALNLHTTPFFFLQVLV